MDTQKMGSLLSRMTEDTDGELRFDSDQVNRVMEILIPAMVTAMPGMPKGFTCEVKKDADGWTIRVNKPTS